jgi:16S rRNA (cytosine967-C5)-methyltransferase
VPPRRPFPPKPSRHESGRAKPHARTAHDLDPRKAAFETLRRMQPGELLEPAVNATLRYLGHGSEYAHRVMPMLEDAARFAGLFDHLVAHLASRPPAELDPDVRAALHLFLSWYTNDPRAVYAHGNAAVELLTPKHKGRGFVNALVRKLGEFVRVEATTPEKYGASPPPLFADRARLGAGRWIVAERAIFPDPAADLAGHLTIVTGLPRYLVGKLIEQHGPEAATQACISSVETPGTWLRVNPLVSDWMEVAQWWTARGTAIEAVDTPFEFKALMAPANLHDLTSHPEWQRGGFYVQDYSAQLVAPALQAEPGDALLDMCSAPGGKAGHLAELTQDRARILACDVTEAKVEMIRENIARMGYRSIALVQADAAEVRFPEKFDRVLVDAPCSNSGVLARRVEARHRVTAESVKELQALQLRILENAAVNLKPGGTIVYSVCSILMDEGPDVIHRFLRGKVGEQRREDLGWEVEYENYLLPVPARHDGGYTARLSAP